MAKPALEPRAVARLLQSRGQARGGQAAGSTRVVHGFRSGQSKSKMPGQVLPENTALFYVFPPLDYY